MPISGKTLKLTKNLPSEYKKTINSDSDTKTQKIAVEE